MIKQKKVIGEIKEEASSIAITHFVALRSKMYSYKTDNKKIDRTAKGIKQIVIKKTIKMYYSITNEFIIK